MSAMNAMDANTSGSVSLQGDEISTLVFSSGGPRAFPVMASCLEMLIVQRKLDLRNITVVRGTSAGAAMALAICLRMTIRELREECNRAVHASSSISFHPSTLFTTFGGSSHGAISNGLAEMMERKGIMRSSTFSELKKRTRCDLCTVATNAIDGQPVIFSAKSTPNASVLDAVVASMAIPFMLEPCRLKLDNADPSTECLCVDGALTYPYPVTIPCEEELEKTRTLGIQILTARSIQNAKTDLATLDFVTYASNMASMLFAKFERCDPSGFVTIQVECPFRGTGFHLAQSNITALEAAAMLATSKMSSYIQEIDTHFVSKSTQTESKI